MNKTTKRIILIVALLSVVSILTACGSSGSDKSWWESFKSSFTKGERITDPYDIMDVLTRRKSETHWYIPDKCSKDVDSLLSSLGINYSYKTANCVFYHQGRGYYEMELQFTGTQNGEPRQLSIWCGITDVYLDSANQNRLRTEEDWYVTIENDKKEYFDANGKKFEAPKPEAGQNNQNQPTEPQKSFWCKNVSSTYRKPQILDAYLEEVIFDNGIWIKD